MQDKAFDLVRNLKVKQLDLLINISRRVSDIKRSSEGAVAEQLNSLLKQLELSMQGDPTNLKTLNEEDLRQQITKTHFDPVIKDLLL